MIEGYARRAQWGTGAGRRGRDGGEADGRLAEFARRYPPTTLLVVYCNGYDCHDSRDLGAKLMKAGYRSVYVFEGGYPEWRDAGYPTEGGNR